MPGIGEVMRETGVAETFDAGLRPAEMARLVPAMVGLAPGPRPAAEASPRINIIEDQKPPRLIELRASACE